MFNIALNTFRELVRNKFFSLILALGILFIILSFVTDTLSLGESKRMIVDMGLSFIELTGLAIVLFLGGGMIMREIEGRTIYLILSKPIPRGYLIYGKFLGLGSLIGITVLLESILLLSICAWKGVSIDGIFLLAILGILLKLLALLALILFFSTFVSPMVALFMTLASYIIGHSGYIMLDEGLRSSSVGFTYFARTILTIFPNLEAVNIKNYVATGAPIELSHWYMGFFSVALYMVVVIVLASHIFERKSFDAV